MKILPLFIVIIFGQISFLLAQPDVIFKHCIAAGTYYNPSFAGTSDKYAVTLNDRSSKENGYNSTAVCFSLDRFVNSVRGGVGIIGYFNQVYYKSTGFF